MLTESTTHWPCYQDSGSNHSGEAPSCTGSSPTALSKARGLGGQKKGAALHCSQLQTPQVLLGESVTRATHEMLAAALFGSFVPEGGKICFGWWLRALSLCLARSVVSGLCRGCIDDREDTVGRGKETEEPTDKIQLPIQIPSDLFPLARHLLLVFTSFYNSATSWGPSLQLRASGDGS